MAIFMIGGGWTDIKVISISHPSRMPQLIQDITQNFNERINRLETLFGIPENLTWSVVTFDQRIDLNIERRRTFLAEGFNDVERMIYLKTLETEQPAEPDDDEVTEVTDFNAYDPHIVGYKCGRVLILLELPAADESNPTHPNLLESLQPFVNDGRLSVQLLNLPAHQTNIRFMGTLYRIEGAMFPDLWYESHTQDGNAIIGHLRHNWATLLENKLREQVQ